ncbi:hypothetical protein QTP86_022693, partial [Hemibagrus guttatus]
MDECVGFETQFSSVMQNVLRTAVGEATKLFEQTLHQLKAELLHLRQENVDLKSGIFTPPYKTEGAGDGCSSAVHAKRDIGVQCEKPTMVERCCSPAPIGDRLNVRHITSERLEDLCSSSSEDGNRQLALLLIKKEPQETDCDEYAPGYFLLKQEGAEPILVRKEPYKNTMEKDQFFPTPENTSDLLQPLPPMPFHSPVVLNQQESNSMIHSQSPGQTLQLAPLLTLKEQQAAASNHGNVPNGGPSMPGEIPMSTVNNFDEHMQRYPSLPSHESTCESDSISVEMQNDDPTENNEGSRPAVIPGPIQHYTVLSKPGPNFIVPDSTKEQQSFRMNMVKDLQIDNDINRQKEGCDTTCQVWEPSDLTGVLPQSALSAPAQTILQKPARKVLEKKTECSECGRILSNASSLENHMRLHRGERPYTCSQCGKAFPSVRGLNRHVKVHAEEKGYKCEECGRSFVYQFTLTKHKLIHSGDRPFPCKVCGKKFLAKADRATHMRMHTGEKPFFCNQCGKTFKHRVALNMHMQGHRGEKRYVCPHCEKGFVDLGNFKRHKRIHTGEKPFECKEC